MGLQHELANPTKKVMDYGHGIETENPTFLNWQSIIQEYTLNPVLVAFLIAYEKEYTEFCEERKSVAFPIQEGFQPLNSFIHYKTTIL